MSNASVRILLATGMVLALAYAFIYFTGPTDGTAGAFTAVPAAGHVLFAAVIVALAFIALKQRIPSEK